MSHTNSSSNGSSPGVTGQKNPSTAQLKKYNAKWEMDPILKSWIIRDPHTDLKVVCRYCHSHCRAHKNDLTEHARTLKHQRNYQKQVSPDEYNSFILALRGRDSQTWKSKLLKSTCKKKKQKQSIVSKPQSNIEPSDLSLSLSLPASDLSISIDSTTLGINGGFWSQVLGSDSVSGSGSDMHKGLDLTTSKDYLTPLLDPNANAKPKTYPRNFISFAASERTNDKGATSAAADTLLPPQHTSSGNSDIGIDTNSNPESKSLASASTPPDIKEEFEEQDSGYPLLDFQQPLSEIEDVLKDIENGCFEFNDLCRIVKAAVTAMEFKHGVRPPRLLDADWSHKKTHPA